MTWLVITAAVLICTVGVPVLWCAVDAWMWRDVAQLESTPPSTVTVPPDAVVSERSSAASTRAAERLPPETGWIHPRGKV